MRTTSPRNRFSRSLSFTCSASSLGDGGWSVVFVGSRTGSTSVTSAMSHSLKMQLNVCQGKQRPVYPAGEGSR